MLLEGEKKQLFVLLLFLCSEWLFLTLSAEELFIYYAVISDFLFEQGIIMRREIPFTHLSVRPKED